MKWMEFRDPERFHEERLHRRAANEGVADGSKVSTSPRPAFAERMIRELESVALRIGEFPMC